MLKINLYPGPRKKEFFKGLAISFNLPLALKDRAFTLSLSLVAVVFALVILSYFLKSHTVNQLKEEIEVAVADSIRYSESIQLINDIKEREEWIRKRIDIIHRVDQNRYLWPRLMADINDALPTVTWLTHIETMSPFPDLVFRIEGVSYSNIEVADFMRRLERLHHVDEVVLINTRERFIDRVSTMNFVIECRYKKKPSGVSVESGKKG